MPKGTAVDRLTLRQLNRATLARQFLLERTSRPALEVIEQLVGMQAQLPAPPYTGLWSRIEGFDFDELSQLVLDRSVVRIVVMRSTVHLLSARDALGLRPLMQVNLDREFKAVRRRALEAAGVDIDAVADRCAALLHERPYTAKQLAECMQPDWPDAPLEHLSAVPRIRLPLVQIPPRGVWGGVGHPTYALLPDWVGAPMEPYPMADVITRYLGAFGPATVRDIQAWCGLTRLRAVVEELRDDLIEFEGPCGEELFDLPDAPRPAPDTPAPVRILPEWDNLLLSHADRTRVISDAVRRGMATSNGMTPGAVLVDGEVAAFSKTVLEKGGAVHRVIPLRRLTTAVQREITAEGERLLVAMGPRYADGHVRIEPMGDRWTAAPQGSAAVTGR